jgi:hypothetical protein
MNLEDVFDHCLPVLQELLEKVEKSKRILSGTLDVLRHVIEHIENNRYDSHVSRDS